MKAGIPVENLSGVWSAAPTPFTDRMKVDTASVRMGIFRTWKNYMDYPLTKSCSRAINQVLKKNADVLWPWREKNHG